jgi:hypothetical protein
MKKDVVVKREMVRDLADLPDGWLTEASRQFAARKRRRNWGWLWLEVIAGTLGWLLMLSGLVTALLGLWLPGAMALVLGLVCLVIAVAAEARVWRCGKCAERIHAKAGGCSACGTRVLR